MFGCRDDRGFGRLTLEAIKFSGAHQLPKSGEGLCGLTGLSILPRCNHHCCDRQVVLLGKGKVAVVMGRNAHHCASAVVGQHIVGDPNGDVFAGEGVLHRAASWHAPFGAVFRHPVLLADGLQALPECLNGLALVRRGELIHQPMLWGEHHITHAKHRVRPCGEHLDGLLSRFLDRKAQGGAAGAANPVGLHGAHPLRPSLELIEVVEKLIGNRRDLEKPLPQFPLFNHGTGTPGAAVRIHLFVGEHGLVNGIPIDRGFLAVGQISFEKLQKQPLGPAVVVAVAGRYLS